MRPKNLSGQIDTHKLSAAPNLPGIAIQSVLDKRGQPKHKYMPSQLGPRRQALNHTHMQHGSMNLDSGFPMSTIPHEMPSATLNIKMDGTAAKVSEFQSHANQVSNSASSRRRPTLAGIQSPQLADYVDQPVEQHFKAAKGVVPPLKLDQHLKVPGSKKS